MCLFNVKQIDGDKDLQEWSSFALNHNAGYFQSFEYYSFCKQIAENAPIILVAYDEENIIGSLLIVLQFSGKGLKRYFSRRAIVTGGPVIENKLNGNSIVEAILEKLNETLARRAIYTEFRNLFNLSQYKKEFQRAGFQYNEHYNVQLKLESSEQINKCISSSKKRQIKNSLREGCKITIAENIEQVRAFYSLLSDLYRFKVKKPLPSWNFFKCLFEISLEKDSIKYLLIEYNNKIVGGILCPVYNGIIYEWYIVGANVENKKIFPGVLATWAAIDYGMQSGLNCFDFMGAGKPTEDYGVRDFKLKFGGELVSHGRFSRINSSFLFGIGKMAMSALKRMR